MMKSGQTNIDPDWAWSAFQPEQPEDWTQRQVAHFYRRCGFAANPEMLQSGLQKSPLQLASEQISNRQESSQVEQVSASLARSVLATADAKNLPAWWTHRLLNTSAPLLEKMTLFWHGHFATGAEKVKDAQLMFDQNQILREHALGNFGSLVHAISQDPAMLIYLDSASNRKVHPNENFAREIMELFVLGEGNYSEKDIRELARCFTGWEIRRDQFYFNRFQHDFDEKIIFNDTGTFTGEQGVDLVLEQPAGAEFVVGKLMQFFIADEGLQHPELIQPLASQFRDSGLETGALLETMLSSNLFYSDYAMGRKIRSPVDFAIGLLNAFEGTTNLLELNRGLDELGQRLFYPPNVKGWEGGRNWINSSTLLARANLMQSLLVRDETRFGGGSLSQYCKTHGVTSLQEAIDWFVEILLAVPLSEPKHSELVQRCEHGSGSFENNLRRGLGLIVSLPEYQLA
ncbi:MAG TPA: hypothetical protein DD473_13985 [Planctomycetaceae bacterium]|nr:hypothetical protein [Planctomycetaceae bacterium]